MYRANDAVKLLFVVKNPATGAAIDADALPTVAVYHDNAVDVAVAVTVAKIATGLYSASAVIPSSTYDPFEIIQFVASYAVSAVAIKAIVGQEFIVADKVKVDMTQAVPVTNDPQTVGDSFNAARAQGFGKWSKVDATLYLYAADGSTLVRTFILDDADNPTSRT